MFAPLGFAPETLRLPRVRTSDSWFPPLRAGLLLVSGGLLRCHFGHRSQIDGLARTGLTHDVSRCWGARD